MCGQEITVSLSKRVINHIKRTDDVSSLDIPAGQREMFITGICDPCWDKMFNFEEEDEE